MTYILRSLNIFALVVIIIIINFSSCDLTLIKFADDMALMLSSGTTIHWRAISFRLRSLTGSMFLNLKNWFLIENKIFGVRQQSRCTSFKCLGTVLDSKPSFQKNTNIVSRKAH